MAPDCLAVPHLPAPYHSLFFFWLAGCNRSLGYRQSRLKRRKETEGPKHQSRSKSSALPLRPERLHSFCVKELGMRHHITLVDYVAWRCLALASFGRYGSLLHLGRVLSLGQEHSERTLRPPSVVSRSSHQDQWWLSCACAPHFLAR